MKVSLWYNNADIRIEEVPTPTPGPGEILVTVMACGICGSDIVEWYRLPRAPLIQGHEIGGQVALVGAGVTKFKVGDRVFVAPKIPCMQCAYCAAGQHPICPYVKERMPGGFAEYTLIPAALVERGAYLLPDHMTYDQSTFIEPFACVVRAQRLAGVTAEKSVLVLGSGMSGLLHIKLAKQRGCRVVATDVAAKRREIAAAVGADVVIDAKTDVKEHLLAETKKKADVVFVCTAAPAAIEQAWQCVDQGGAVVFFAVPGPDCAVTIPINDFWRKEIRVLTSYYCGPPDIEESMRLLAAGTIAVDDLVTHHFPLKEIVEGFRLVKEGRESLKVIIDPQG